MKIVLFDRSIFHGTKFDQLISSGLDKHVKLGKLKVFFTPMFLEETLTHSQINMPEFSSHWNFITSINGQKWFKLAEEIVSIELGDRIKGEKYYLRPKERVHTVMRGTKKLIDGTLPQSDLNEIVAEIEHNRENRRQFRQARLDMRYSNKPGKGSFSTFFDDEVEWYIENLLMPHHKDDVNYLNTWRTKRKQCKFTEQFIRSSLATIFLPVSDHNLKVGANDNADSEQLAFLLWADMIISDDTKYMRAAFQLLHGNSDKRFLTLSEFLLSVNSA
jgi:hypothetical protein